MTGNSFIVFDSEFTDNTGELLELSIYNVEGEEIFHSYFKPRRAKTWMLYPHNITPEMVADAPSVASKLPELQAIFDNATHLVGFEVESDIDHLHEEGVADLYGKRAVEVRELYWLCRGKEGDFGLYSVPSLEKSVASMGIAYDDNGAHSASGDTLVTLRLFLALMAELNAEGKSLEQAYDDAVDKINEEKGRLAHGYVTLLRDGQYYRVNGGTLEPNTSAPRYECHIEVADWKRAICEIEFMRYSTYNRSPRDGFYKLTPKEIRQFMRYSNVYDPARAEEFRRMYNLFKRRKGGR